jgi:hypothetical protein
MKREALAVQITGWALIAISFFDVIARSTWVSSDGMGLQGSDGAGYGILCGMGLTVTGKALARIDVALEKRDAPPPS